MILYAQCLKPVSNQSSISVTTIHEKATWNTWKATFNYSNVLVFPTVTLIRSVYDHFWIPSTKKNIHKLEQVQQVQEDHHDDQEGAALAL